MRNKMYILTLTFLMFTINFSAQNKYGEVIYEASLWQQKQLNYDTIKKTEEVEKVLKTLLNNSKTIKYKLLINNNTSKFEPIKNFKSNNILLKVLVGKGKFYHDKLTTTTYLETNTYDQDFIIEYPKTEWNIMNESKVISGYKCFKAITKIKNAKTLNYHTITAWFTTQIPINYGPSYFANLPGLIIKLDFEQKYSLTAIKITLNPKEKINISIPSKGKQLTLAKYEAMLANLYKNRRK